MEGKMNGQALELRLGLDQLPSKDTFREVPSTIDELIGFDLHAAHVMLWCPAKETDAMENGGYPLRYRIPMQLRFDGRLGFSGGFVDEVPEFLASTTNPTIQDFIEVIRKGLLREVQEEMRITIDKVPRYVFSSTRQNVVNGVDHQQSTVMHFFTCEVSLAVIEKIEGNLPAILDEDEVLGITRVPLFTMKDGDRGFPYFLTNAFAGNSREQLIRGCMTEQFLSEEQMKKAIGSASKLLNAVHSRNTNSSS